MREVRQGPQRLSFGWPLAGHDVAPWGACAWAPLRAQNEGAARRWSGPAEGTTALWWPGKIPRQTKNKQARRARPGAAGEGNSALKSYVAAQSVALCTRLAVFL